MLRLPENGEEKALAKALFSHAIAEATVEEIKQVLRLVMIKVGLRAQNFPAEEEKMVLIEHIISNFGGNRIDEIKLAFDMALVNKLDLKPEDSKCYENFSCAYFSLVMGAYRHWSEQAIKSIVITAPEPQRIFTSEELDDSAREDAERQYQLFLKGNDLRGVGMNRAILQKDGLLKEAESVMEFFKRRAENLATNIYRRNP